MTIKIARTSNPVSSNSAISLTPLPELSLALDSNKKYVGKLTLLVNQTTAADGLQIDFAGGSVLAATFSGVLSVSSAGGPFTIVSQGSGGLSGVLSFSKLTGNNTVVVNVTLNTSAGGSIVPRFAVFTHTTGTLKVLPGSSLVLDDAYVSPPGINKRIVRAPWKYDPADLGTGIPGTLHTPGVAYVAPVAVDPPEHPLNAPSLEIPMLYHAGTARACGPDPSNVATADATINVQNGTRLLQYVPSTARQWGKAGTLLRIPRVVVIQSGSGDFGQAQGIVAAAASALAAAQAAVVVFSGATNTFMSRLTDWAPANLQPVESNTNVVTAPLTDLPVPIESWLGGEILFLDINFRGVLSAVTPKHFGHGYVLSPPVNAAGWGLAGWTVATLTNSASVPFQVMTDNNAIAAGRALYAAALQRVTRFAGVFLYDPAPPSTAIDPALLTAIEGVAGVKSDDVWHAATDGLAEWTRVQCPGSAALSLTAQAAAVAAAVSTAISQFWPSG